MGRPSMGPSLKVPLTVVGRIVFHEPATFKFFWQWVAPHGLREVLCVTQRGRNWPRRSLVEPLSDPFIKGEHGSFQVIRGPEYRPQIVGLLSYKKGPHLLATAISTGEGYQSIGGFRKAWELFWGSDVP